MTYPNLLTPEEKLANYPAVPDGYDGWWTFQPARTTRGGAR